MLRFFYIGIGGAAGALLRYWMSGAVHSFLNSDFPWGTLSVNLFGSLVIGFLWGMFEFITVSQDVRLLLFIGILGSFTTFSTFSLENFNLFHNGEYTLLAMNVIVSVFFGIALIFAGYFTGRFMFNLMR